MVVSCFSAGVSSAVATKLAINDIDKILYTHIDDQHPDTMRFVRECEEWFGKPVEILQSPYKSVDTACRMASYVNGVAGAPCTRLLKRRVRQEWETEQTTSVTYVWGFDVDERNRAERVPITMPSFDHRFPLIENSIDKKHAHQILFASGIKRPAMYEMGYNNNNCLGCVKGGMGYWNHIRVDFPEVFNARCELERAIGGTCIKGVYLDELDPEAGRHTPPVVDDCGIFCEAMGLPEGRADRMGVA